MFHDYYNVETKIWQHQLFEDNILFYKHQRTSKNILIEKDRKPVGGKWTFDAENRMRYPKDKIQPTVTFPEMNEFSEKAFEYTHKNFPENYGELNPTFL